MDSWLPWPAAAAVAAALAACAWTLRWVWVRPQAVVAHARPVLIVAGIVSAAALAAIVRLDPPGVRLQLDPSEEPMIARGDPARKGYAEAVRTFGDDDVFVVAMQTLGPASDDVFTPTHLSALRTIGDRIRALPGVRSVESLADTTEFRYDPARGRIEIDDFLDEIPRDDGACAELRRRALADPIYTGNLVSADGRTAAINVSFVPMTDGQFVEAGLDDAIAGILATQAAPDLRFFVSGRKHIKARAHAIMVHDLLTLIPLAMVAGALVAWRMTGSAAAGFLPVGVSLVATLWVFGLLCVLDRPLNIITLVLGPMLICVGSVYGVHVYARFEEFAAHGLAPAEAAETCIDYSRLPVLIAALTTVFGFAALTLGGTQAIEELGVYSAVGVTAAWTIALTAFPVLLAMMPRRLRPTPARDRLGRLLGTIGHVTSRRPTVVLAAWAAAAVAAAVLIPRIVIDTDYVSFFDARSRVRTDFAAIGRLLAGAMPIYVTLDGHREGFFREPDNLRRLQMLQQRVDELDGVAATLSVVDFLEQLNRAFERGDPAAAHIPDTRGEVAEELFLIPKDLLRRFADSNHSRVNLLVRTGWSGSADIRRLESRLLEATREAGFGDEVGRSVTGKTILVNHVADGIAGTQSRSVGAATLAIFALATWAFGSWRIGAIAMVPNVVPVLLYFGLLGAGAATLSLPTSLIGCIALGIAVDDTAHFLVAYRRRRAEGMTPPQAAAECVERLGRPIVVTSVMLMAGFLVFLISGFATLRELGVLLALTMALCLAGDLLLLPALLVRTRT